MRRNTSPNFMLLGLAILALILDGDQEWTVTVGWRGRAKAKWQHAEEDDHEVCLIGCQMCTDTTCQP